MKLIVIPVVLEALGTGLNCFEMRLEELEIKESSETIQTVALLRSARILSRVPQKGGD